MQRLTINPDFQALFNEHGLNSVQAFMAYQGGEVLEDNKKRDTRRIQLGGQAFYLKRTKVEKTSSAVERLLMLGIPHSKPYNEAIHVAGLQQAGINTMTVAATGELLKLGLPQCGFILSQEVKGQEMEAVFQAADADTRNSIAKAFGQLLAELHRKGFYATTRLKDIFCEGEVSDYKNYRLIDRETRNPFPKRYSQKRALESLKNGFRRQARDGSGFNREEMSLLVAAYCKVLELDSSPYLLQIQTQY